MRKIKLYRDKRSNNHLPSTRPQTHLMVNIGNPDTAFQTALLPTDGVGLARMEFIVAEHIKVHPMALVHPEKIDDPAVREQITRLTHGYRWDDLTRR